MASLCHPWFTATNLSYRFPIFETSATALCGTTGNYIYTIQHVIVYFYIYIYTHECTMYLLAMYCHHRQQLHIIWLHGCSYSAYCSCLDFSAFVELDCFWCYVVYKCRNAQNCAIAHGWGSLLPDSIAVALHNRTTGRVKSCILFDFASGRDSLLY